jgi:hypothetical protein
MSTPKPNAKTSAAQAVATTTDAKTAYEAVLDTITKIHRTGQARAIQSMWHMGQVVDEFLNEVEKSEGSRYGTFGIDKLAEDLARRDVCSAGRSTLYHARKVFRILSFEQIEALAARGYTTHHVKALLPLSDEIRTKVHAELIDPKTNQIIPIGVLNSKIEDLQSANSRTRADAALAAPSPADAVQAAVDSGPAAAVANGYVDEAGEAAPDADGNPELTPPDKAPLSAATKGAPDYSRPPLPGVKKMTKALNAVVSTVSDAVVALKEVPKIGFDSTTAAKNWLQAREELRASLTDAQRYISETLAVVLDSAANDGLGEFVAPTADEVKAAKKGKKGRK